MKTAASKQSREQSTFLSIKKCIDQTDRFIGRLQLRGREVSPLIEGLQNPLRSLMRALGRCMDVRERLVKAKRLEDDGKVLLMLIIYLCIIGLFWAAVKDCLGWIFYIM